MLEIYTREVTPFAQNARVLIDSDSRAAVVVDPGGDIDILLECLRSHEPKAVQIWLTHAHIDHGGGVANLLPRIENELGVTPVLYAFTDSTLRNSIAQQAAVFGLGRNDFKDVPEPDVLLSDNDTLEIGALHARVLWTPGHAPDHISLFFENVSAQLDSQATHSGPLLIAGDALFAGSIGRTDLPGGSYPTLLQSIKDKLLVLPDETLVLSGHGPNTSIGVEKTSNPFLR